MSGVPIAPGYVPDELLDEKPRYCRTGRQKDRGTAEEMFKRRMKKRNGKSKNFRGIL